MAPSLKLYFDILSPFAYIAFHVVTTSKVFDECEVELVPAFLGDIMKHAGSTAPSTVTDQDKLNPLERPRSAALFNVPMKAASPPGFPVQTLAVQRHLAALREQSAAHIVPVASALYARFFVQHEPIKDAKDFMPIFEAVLGPELAASVHEAASGAGKAALDANTSAAIADGAFGLPWFVVTRPDGRRETFWGVDHLTQVVHALGLDQRPDPGVRSVL